MGATTVYSAQLTDARALAAGTGYSLRSGLNETGGRVHVAYANWTSTAVESGSDVVMLKVPKNARILRGVLATEGIGTNVTGAVWTDVSLKTDAGVELTANTSQNNCLAASAIASAAKHDFCVTRLLGAGGLTSAETSFIIRTGGATATADKQVQMWVEYLQN